MTEKDLYIVETRTLRIAQKNETFLACEYVYFASTVELAEHWMLGQNPGTTERYYYCVVRVPVDADHDFEMIGYYNILGEKSTQDRCVQTLVLR